MQALFGFMQADDDQHQLSKASHQVTTPGSTFGGVAPPHNQLAYKTSPMYAATGPQHSPCQALQGPSHHRAASALPLGSEPQKGLFPATMQPSMGARPPMATLQQTPQAVHSPPQPPSHPPPADPGQATASPLHSFRHQSLPPQSVPVASIESHSTSHPQQRCSPSGQWVHPIGRRGMLPTGDQAQAPLSSIHASVSTAEPNRGLPKARDAMPDVNYSTCTWNVPPQLQSQPYAMTAPQSSLTATPATSGWAASHLGPPSLHPRPHTQAPHPSLPPRHPTPGPYQYHPSSHPFPGQGSSIVPPNRPPSRCDHPSFAHLDLSRPLCLQQPPVFGHPGVPGSYSASPHAVVDAQQCFQQPNVSGCVSGSLGNYPRSASPYAADDGLSLQQQSSSTVADVHHRQQLQQPCEGDQQGGGCTPLRPPPLSLDLQAQQQGQGQGQGKGRGPFFAGCYPQQLKGQPQAPLTSTAYPVTCAVSHPQLGSCAPTGMTLQTTLA